VGKQSILVVDDVRANLDVIVGILSSDYQVLAATSGKIALDIIEQVAELPDLILLDIVMPDMDGFSVCRLLKSNLRTLKIPIIFLTGRIEEADEERGLAAGAVDYISKPIRPGIVKARIKTHLALYDQTRLLEDLVRERTREVSVTQDVVIHGLASLAETRDNETGRHLQRTQQYVKTLALELQKKPAYRSTLCDSTIDLMYKSAPLHDIGKVGIPDRILLKPGKLTAEEFEIMKAHPLLGRDAISDAEQHLGSSSFLSIAREIAHTHHEKWDGTGYPQGLKGTDIPLSGRLMALADVYDALITRRVYKPAFSHETAKAIILEGQGSHFDPEIVTAFLNQEETFIQIAERLVDEVSCL